MRYDATKWLQQHYTPYANVYTRILMSVYTLLYQQIIGTCVIFGCMTASSSSPKVLIRHRQPKLFNDELPDWEATTIRCTAVRETCVSRHHGIPIITPLKPSRTSQHYGVEGLKEGLWLGPHYAEKRQSLGPLYAWSWLVVTCGRVSHAYICMYVYISVYRGRIFSFLHVSLNGKANSALM